MLTDTSDKTIKRHNHAFPGYTHTKETRAKNLAGTLDGFNLAAESRNTPKRKSHLVYHQTEQAADVIRTTLRIIPEYNNETGVIKGYTVIRHPLHRDPAKGDVLTEETVFTQALDTVETSIEQM